MEPKTKQSNIQVFKETQKDRKKADAFSPNRLVNPPSQINQTFLLIKSDVSEPYKTFLAHGPSIQISAPYKFKKPQMHGNLQLNQIN